MLLTEPAKNIFLIDDFWTEAKCEFFIARTEAAGYEAATIDTEKGPKIIESVRNNNRLIYTDPALADEIWQDLKPFAPSQIGNSLAVGLNEMFRFYRYTAGQKFKAHADQSFIRNETEASYYTLMIYLNGNCQGGETSFKNAAIKPKQGAALIFLHSLIHEGNEVTEGVKYVLRTDIMYRLCD